jgi:hypothetical protein
MPGCREALASENMIMFVDDSYDMQILVRIYATDNATNGHILSDFHDGIPGSS